jgi:zinc protease
LRLIASALLLASGCANTPPALPPLFQLGLDDFQARPASGQLAGGLRLIHERVPGSSAVAIVLTVRAGSNSDPPGKEGLAHLVEHLTFRVEDAGALSRWDRYRRLGASRFNAFTGHEATTFVSVVPRNSLVAALTLALGLLRDPLPRIDDHLFELEKEVVKNENIWRNESSISGSLLRWSSRALFPPDDQYRRSVGGTLDTVAALDSRDAIHFATTFYRPSNAAITVVGDVTASEVERAVAAAWPGTAESGPVVQTAEVASEPPIPPPGDLAHEEAALARKHLWIGWTLPSSQSELGALAPIVTRMLNLTVATSVRGQWDPERADVASISFFSIPGARAQMVFADIALQAGTAPERTLEAVLARVARLGNDPEVGGPPTFALAALVVAAVSDLLRAMEDPLVRAMRYAEADHLTGHAGRALDAVRRLAQMDPADFRRFAGTYLSRSRARAALVTPMQADAGSLPAGPALVLGSPPVESEMALLPPVVPRPKSAEAHSFQLSNGLEVVLWRRPGFPVVTAALGFRGGWAAANPPGAETLLDRPLPLDYCAGNPRLVRGIDIDIRSPPVGPIELASGGAGGLSAVLLSLAEQAAAYELDSWPVLDNLHTELCPEMSLPVSKAELWRDTARMGRRRTDQRDLVGGLSVQRAPFHAVLRNLLGGTDYLPRGVDEDEPATSAQLRDWYLSSRRPERGTLVVAGAFDPAEAERLVRGWFESWRPPSPPRAPRAPSGARPGGPPGLLTFARPGVDQAEILIGCPVPSRSSAERSAGQLLVSMLRRDIWLRLREGAGVSYDVSDDVIDLGGDDALGFVSADVAGRALAPALVGAVKDLDGIAAGRPPPGLLSAARLDVRGVLGGPVLSAALARQAVEVRLRGRPLTDLDTAAEEVMRVPEPMVATAALHCRAHLSLAATADPAALTAASTALKELGIETPAHPELR